MGRDSVISALRENADRIVELHFTDGEIQTASIIMVEDDGVLYELIASNRETPNYSRRAALWTTFDEVMTVLPRPGLADGAIEQSD
jgi:hypothetical protein